MRIFLILILLTISGQCFGFEALVRATGHYRDNISTAGFTTEEWYEWNARSQKGDIIAVRPDGWKWQRLECLPDYVVVKIPAVPHSETIEHYCDTLEDPTTKKLLKRRKFRVPENIVNGWVNAGNSVVTITSANSANFINKLVKKLQ